MITIQNPNADWQTKRTVNAFNEDIKNGLYPNMDFTNSVYVTKKVTMEIGCITHGVMFKATLADIRNGKRTGCVECSLKNTLKNKVLNHYQESLGDSSWMPLEDFVGLHIKTLHVCVGCDETKNIAPNKLSITLCICSPDSTEDWEKAISLAGYEDYFRNREHNAVKAKNKLYKKARKEFKSFLKEHTQVRLVKGTYTNKSTKATFKCKDCGDIFDRLPRDLQDKVNRRNSLGCVKCSRQQGWGKQQAILVKQMYNNLEANGIECDHNITSDEFQTEFTFKECEHKVNLTYSYLRTIDYKCPICEKLNQWHKVHKVYYIELYGRYKVGVTNKEGVVGKSSITNRYHYPQDREAIRVVKVWDGLNRSEAFTLEAKIKKDCDYARYRGDSLFADGTGTTEMFTHDVLGLDNDI